VHVSSTEPKILRELGTASTLPEKYGADFLMVTRIGLVGVQRKEVSDLIASLQDGRLSKELGQMRSLALGVVIIEGVPQWSRDGYLLSARSFRKSQWDGVCFSIQAEGLWLVRTSGVSETASSLASLESWLSKERHGIRTRPKANGAWGTADNREWGIHLLQSFPGIGADTAANIYDYFEGVPLIWLVNALQLQEVKGVGRGRAEKMFESLRRTSGNTET
jgi:DNA excision repair protein ERCC-4